MAYNSFLLLENQNKKFYAFVVSLDIFCTLMKNFEFMEFLAYLETLRGKNFFKNEKKVVPNPAIFPLSIEMSFGRIINHREKIFFLGIT